MSELQHYVMIVHRMGGKDPFDGGYYILGPGSKKDVIKTVEDAYRKERQIPSSVALHAQVLYSGSEAQVRFFDERFQEKLRKKKESEVNMEEN